ncbi:MAG: hypothetical protein JO092_02725, partial [Candidatus Eremiobacteraeota bacterium]|nr:hypothetical protein [Candidatus Eremiobacteraeota bacterium]
MLGAAIVFSACSGHQTGLLPSLGTTTAQTGTQFSGPHPRASGGNMSLVGPI